MRSHRPRLGGTGHVVAYIAELHPFDDPTDRLKYIDARGPLEIEHLVPF